jgi:oligopeptide transport system substrate-binding protein
LSGGEAREFKGFNRARGLALVLPKVDSYGELVNVLPAALALVLTLASVPALPETVLYRGVYGEPESLDPHSSRLVSENTILSDLFEGLTTYDVDGNVGPGVAASWQVSEDGLTWRFRLRPQLAWSDGEPFTAADFVYSFRRAMTPATASPVADRLFVLRNAEAVLRGEVEPSRLGVSAPTPDEVLLELEHPAPQLPTLLANGVGLPLPRHALDRWGQNWNEAGRMVGNGAYVLAERRAGARISLARNPLFHAAGDTRTDTIIYIPSDNVDTQVNRFRSGELHINRNPGFPPQRKALLERELGAAVRVSPYPLSVYLRVNLRRTPLDDLNVRRGLALAIDRDKIARLVLKSGEQPAYHLVPATVSGYEPPASPFAEGTVATRIETARELLASAGYSTSKPLTLSLRYPTGWAREMCIAIAAMWRDVGVRVSLENSEIKSMVADVRRGDFDLAYDGAIHDNPWEYLLRVQPGSTYNAGGYQSDAFSRTLAAAKLEPDLEKRREGLRTAEAIALADVAIIPVIYSVSRSLVAPSVRGWHPNPMDVHLSRYLWVEQ